MVMFKKGDEWVFTTAFAKLDIFFPCFWLILIHFIKELEGTNLGKSVVNVIEWRTKDVRLSNPRSTMFEARCVIIIFLMWFIARLNIKPDGSVCRTKGLMFTMRLGTISIELGIAMTSSSSRGHV